MGCSGPKTGEEMNRFARFLARPDVAAKANRATVALIATTVVWIGLTGIAQVIAWNAEPEEEIFG
jgi:hypothetical protein